MEALDLTDVTVVANDTGGGLVLASLGDPGLDTSASPVWYSPIAIATNTFRLAPSLRSSSCAVSAPGWVEELSACWPLNQGRASS